MATIKQEVTFFNDSVGRVLPGAKIFSYVAGDINTPKNTYTDKTLNFANEWPVQADANGIFPVMWAELGDYLLVYTDTVNVEFARRDDVSTGESVGLSAPTFNNVSDLVGGITFSGDTINLTAGTICRTEGEAALRDSRASDWVIIAAGPTIDGFKYIALDNGLVAERLPNIVSGMQTCSFITDSAGGAVRNQICSNATQLDLIDTVTRDGLGRYTIRFNYDIKVHGIQTTGYQAYVETTSTFSIAPLTTGTIQMDTRDSISESSQDRNVQCLITFEV